jgi:aminopeptidase-like protein
VTIFLARWIASGPRRYTYRVAFVPETIGSITYLSRHLHQLQRRVIAGFTVTCVGDDRAHSYLPSRKGDTLADRVALNILKTEHPDFIRHSYLERGSDERQYCSPGVDLPVASVMRSKYCAYPEYHTSLDDLSLVTPEGLQGGFAVLRDCLVLLENNRVYRSTCVGEPHLSRRGLYPDPGSPDSRRWVTDVLDVLAYADGTNDLVDMSNVTGLPARRLYPLVAALRQSGLLEEVPAEERPGGGAPR